MGRTFVLLAWFSCLAGAVVSIAPAQQRNQQPSIRMLVANLGHPDFDVREEATKALLRRPDALEAVRECLHSSDAEIARRAAHIMAESRNLSSKQVCRWLADGQLDLAGEAFALRKWDDEPATWQFFLRAANQLVARVKQSFNEGETILPAWEIPLPLGDLLTWNGEGSEPYRLHSPATPHPQYRENALVRHFLVRGDMVTCGMLESSFSVSGRQLQIVGEVLAATIWACEPVRLDRTRARWSLVICDGEFVARNASKLIVIANGNVSLTPRDAAAWMTHSRILATGTVTLPEGKNSAGTKFQQNHPKPLDFVRFFEPAQFGLRVAAATDAVRITEVTAKMPFAVSGLEIGDLVTALGDRLTPSPDTFRRALRRRIAEGQGIQFTVRRGTRPLTVFVPAYHFIPID